MNAITSSNKRRNQNRQSSNKHVVILATFIGIWFIVIFAMMNLLDSNLHNNILPRRHLKGNNTRHGVQNKRPIELPKYPIDHRDASLNPPLSDEAITQCHKALWHTLETTTYVLPNEETFVITGDIKDMWLRDSAAQIHPLLLLDVYQGKSLVQLDAKLERVVSGLILKAARFIRFDPYANAFKLHNNTNFTKFEREILGRRGYIATRNYELDSGCYFMRMLYFFYQNFPTHPVLARKEVTDAVNMMVDLWIAEQKHELEAFPSGELFDCFECGRSYWYNPQQLQDGKGTKTNASAGLTWSGFRPSDDPCVYGYIIPSNMFAVVVLEYMMEMTTTIWKDQSLLRKAKKLKDEIQGGIDRYGTVQHDTYGKMYAYEVDGLGNYLLEDDANIPSLLSIPYLGYKYDEEVYANTKRFIFSPDNPQYHKGHNKYNGEIEGIGSSHAHKLWEVIPDDIWPMSLIMKGLITNDPSEKTHLVYQLLQASAGTGWMHESFNANDPTNFTRSWFCWPDSLFAELVMSLTDDCPRSDRAKYIIKEWNDTNVIGGSVFSAIG